MKMHSMIVEFVGSTSAGKTTLAAEVERRLAERARAVTAFDLMADLLGSRSAANPTIRNLIQDVVGFPFFVASLYRNRAFLGFAIKTLVRNAKYRILIPNYLRSIARKVGTHEAIKRLKGDRIVLVDEGTVLSAYLLFAYTRGGYKNADIEKFTSLVPLPELVVYVRAPVNILIQRSLERSDTRREMKSKNEALVSSQIIQAVEMFDELTRTRELRDRILEVTNPVGTGEERGVIAARIVDWILKHRLSEGYKYDVPGGGMAQASTSRRAL